MVLILCKMVPSTSQFQHPNRGYVMSNPITVAFDLSISGVDTSKIAGQEIHLNMVRRTDVDEDTTHLVVAGTIDDTMKEFSIKISPETANVIGNVKEFDFTLSTDGTLGHFKFVPVKAKKPESSRRRGCSNMSDIYGDGKR